ncbi:unnamed protein product, partial [Prorocentrum cordatum]
REVSLGPLTTVKEGEEESTTTESPKEEEEVQDDVAATPLLEQTEDPELEQGGDQEWQDEPEAEEEEEDRGPVDEKASPRRLCGCAAWKRPGVRGRCRRGTKALRPLAQGEHGET